MPHQPDVCGGGAGYRQLRRCTRHCGRKLEDILNSVIMNIHLSDLLFLNPSKVCSNSVFLKKVLK